MINALRDWFLNPVPPALRSAVAHHQEQRQDRQHQIGGIFACYERERGLLEYADVARTFAWAHREARLGDRLGLPVPPPLVQLAAIRRNPAGICVLLRVWGLSLDSLVDVSLVANVMELSPQAGECRTCLAHKLGEHPSLEGAELHLLRAWEVRSRQERISKLPPAPISLQTLEICSGDTLFAYQVSPGHWLEHQSLPHHVVSL